jgi:hypothetical protein
MAAVWLWLALVSAATPVAPDPRVAQATRLFDQLCIQAFPDDDALARTAEAAGAKPMAPEQVKVTLVNDPGRGWTIRSDGTTYLVFLELPPFHACSVRWTMPEGRIDLSGYRTLIAPIEQARGGFVPVPDYDADRGNIHIHAIGEQRGRPDTGTEAFFVFDQHVNDAARDARGETSVNWRFVRQMTAPR